MKKLLSFLLALLLLTGCSAEPAPVETEPSLPEETVAASMEFSGVLHDYSESGGTWLNLLDLDTTLIHLSDDGITVNGEAETDAVYTSHDIIYYEDKDTYESGNPYGEGEKADKHSAGEAAAHTVVNITAPGVYHVTGSLSAGQIRIDLGEEAYSDPNAVVGLILEDVDITCTVAPAILFLNVYECDGDWSVETAKAEVDTSAAGANLILQGENAVTGSHVAKIYKDKEGEKKLWKQDGAIYSYMSMNVYGPGSLDLTADNEGLDTELHLTVYGGDIAIRADNDGINTNEDGVSVTTINGGSLRIIAGLGAEGDGIDSNGYLVINGGTVVAAANPAADAGLDSDLGSFVNGGTVLALGSSMDWAESDSGQVTMNLQFAQYQSSGSAILICKEDGTVVFAYDPSEDEILGEHTRQYMGAIVSRPELTQGDSYYVYTGGTVSGEEIGGLYTKITGYEGGTRMQYTGTDVMIGPGGFRPGNFGGQMPQGEPPAMPQGENMPQDFDPENFTMPEGMEMPEGGFGGEMPEGMEIPEGGFRGDKAENGGEMPQGGFGGRDPMGGMTAAGEGNTLFYMQDMVNFFSGLTAVTK